MKTKKKIKNLLNPTPQQIKVRNRKWAEALIKNKKKANEEMYDSNGGRCCLAVAQDVAISCGVEIPEEELCEHFPHTAVAQFFGWTNVNPDLHTPIGSDSSGNINDESEYSFGGSRGMSHKKIAQCVLNTFVHPSKKEWNFKLENVELGY